jgi:hypothetical protein
MSLLTDFGRAEIKPRTNGTMPNDVDSDESAYRRIVDRIVSGQPASSRQIDSVLKRTNRSFGELMRDVNKVYQCKLMSGEWMARSSD